MDEQARRWTGPWFLIQSAQYKWHRAGADHEDRQPFASGIPSGPGEPADGNDWVLVIEVE